MTEFLRYLRDTILSKTRNAGKY